MLFARLCERGKSKAFEPRRDGVQPFQEARMHERMIDDPSPLGICRDVVKLPPEILPVANPVLMETWLPDFPGKLHTHFM